MALPFGCLVTVTAIANALSGGRYLNNPAIISLCVLGLLVNRTHYLVPATVAVISFLTAVIAPVTNNLSAGLELAAVILLSASAVLAAAEHVPVRSELQLQVGLAVLGAAATAFGMNSEGLGEKLSIVGFAFLVLGTAMMTFAAFADSGKTSPERAREVAHGET